MLVDSHCHIDHLDLTLFNGQLKNVFDNATQHGVTRMLCAGIDLACWPALYQQVEPYQQVDIAVGLHPNTAAEQPLDEALMERYAQSPRVVALGETGLDYYHHTETVHKRSQQESFCKHIAMARRLKKPLIIHTRDATLDTLSLLRSEGASEIGGVIHCFTETWDVAVKAMDLNFYISLSGIVTYKNASALRDVAKKLPIDRLLVETDAPYLAPVPYRGKPNQPAWVRHVAECVAKSRGESLEQVAASTTANYHRLFGFPATPAI